MIYVYMGSLMSPFADLWFSVWFCKQCGFANVEVTPVTARTVRQKRGQGKEARGTLILLISGLLNRVQIFYVLM